MISELFRITANQYRDSLAIVDRDERISYGELFERVAGMRDRLRMAMDPKPGEVIAASLSNTWQFAACLFALAERGAVCMPCNPQWRVEELRWLARRVGFRGVLAEPQFRAEWERLEDGVRPEPILTMDGTVPQRQAGEPGPLPRHGTEVDPLVYLTTSGSTGVPRIVPRTHGNLRAGARNLGQALGIGPGRRLLSVAPFFHSNGIHNCLLMPLLRGATVVLMRQFSPAAGFDLVHRERVDTLIASPFIYSALADCEADARLLSSLEFCFSTGARLSPGVRHQWSDRFRLTVRQLYGMSETNVISIDRRSELDASADASIGAPIPGVEIKVLDADGKELDRGAVGELAVRSESVTPGYVGETELNQRVFAQGFFRTGDLGYADPAGNLYLSGRARRVLNIAGAKVDPAEIEQAVEMLAGVSQCRVDMVSNGRGGEVIRARILTRAGFEVTRRAVIAHCRERLAEYKLPRVIDLEETSAAAIAGKMPQPWARESRTTE